RRLLVGAGSEGTARLRVRLQPERHVHGGAGDRVPRLATGADHDFGALRLALGGDPRLGAHSVWWIRRSLPESPRWLAQRGRLAEADAIVADMERHTKEESGRELPPPEAVAGETEEKRGAWTEMWSEAYRGRTIMLVAFPLVQTIGYYGFNNWVPTLLLA